MHLSGVPRRAKKKNAQDPAASAAGYSRHSTPDDALVIHPFPNPAHDTKQPREEHQVIVRHAQRTDIENDVGPRRRKTDADQQADESKHDEHGKSGQWHSAPPSEDRPYPVAA